MRQYSPRQVAILISTAAAIVVSGILLFTIHNNIDIIFIIITVILTVFIVTYIVSYYLINNLILKKIYPIYESIFDLNIKEKDLKKRFEDKDIVEEVTNDAFNWANRKSKEIKKLRKLEKYRKEFLGNVSHELKTPIFNIQGYILTLLDGGIEDKDINNEYLHRAEKNINRMISIVEDLEKISKLESGILRLHIKNFNIVKLFEEVFELQEMRAEERQISLVFEKPDTKSIHVLGDRGKILEAINNLVNNSIKYGKEGGQTTVSFKDIDKNILIEIADNGIGIDKRDMPRIFERFYRVDRSRSREMGGTGLGLSIVKHIIEAHKRTINVKSIKSGGTVFSFSLPKAF